MARNGGTGDRKASRDITGGQIAPRENFYNLESNRIGQRRENLHAVVCNIIAT